MLLSFSSNNLSNCDIIDCASGNVVFRVVTSEPAARSRSRLGHTLYSLASSSFSRERFESPLQKITTLTGADGAFLAGVTWDQPDERVVGIQIGNEMLAGNYELFDPAFIRVYPDEAFIPTRMEYVWRTTPDDLELLDDDGEVIVKLHSDCVLVEDRLVPPFKEGAGDTYLELTTPMAADDLVEILVTFILMTALRARMYWLSGFVYGREKSPLHQAFKLHSTSLQKLRRQAKQSLATFRTLLRRNS